MISAAAYPYIPSAAGFQLVIIPSRLSPTMASSDELTIAENSRADARSRFTAMSSTGGWAMTIPPYRPGRTIQGL